MDADIPKYSVEWLDAMIDSAVQAEYLPNGKIIALERLLDLRDDTHRFRGALASRATLHAHLGRVLFELNLPEEAVNAAWTSYELEHAAHPDRANGRYMTLGAIAGYYRGMGLPDSALAIYRQAYALLRNVRPHPEEFLENQRLQAAALNNIGMFFLSADRLDSARHYYNAAIDAIGDREGSFTNLKISVLDNLAELALLQNDPVTALRHYGRILEILPDADWPLRVIYTFRFIKTAYGRIEAYLHLDDHRQARKILRDASDSLATLPPTWISDGFRLRHLQAEYKVATAEKRWRAAWHESEKMRHHFRDRHDEFRRYRQGIMSSLARRRVVELSARRTAEARLAAARLGEEEAKARAQQLLVLLILASVLVVTAILWMRLRRRRRDMAARARLHNLEQQLLESDLSKAQAERGKIATQLAYKRQDIQALAIDIGRKKKRAETLLTFVNSLRSMNAKARLDALSALEKDIRRELRVDDRTQHFDTSIDRVNHEFHQRLKAQFPRLSQADRELCGLIRIGRSNAEIAEMRNISVASARTARYRLKKKLGHEGDLQAFLEGIFATQGGEAHA